MKKLYFALCILCIVSNISLAQWIPQYSSNYLFSDILFLNESTGFVTSYSHFEPSYEIGAVFKTTNGGISYTPPVDSFPDSFNNLFKAGNDIFAFGDNYRFIVSSDSGKTWQVKSHAIEELTSSFFINQNTGWIGGIFPTPEIYKTTDKGDTWFLQHQNSGLLVSSIYFENELIGMATIRGDQGDQGVIIKTTNGGSNWITAYNGGTNDRDLEGITYNNGRYFAIGGKYADNTSKLLISTDHGVTWFSDSTSILRFSNALASPFRDISFFNDSSGFIVGISGYLFRTTNNGNTWIKQLFGNNAGNAIFSLNDMISWILSYPIYKTTNGGWDFPSTPVPLLPSNNYTTVSDSISFRWFFATNTATYHLQISADSAFINHIDSNSIEKNFVNIENLQPSVYYWRVRSNGVLGNSPWSLRRVFTVLPSSIQQINNEIPGSINLFQNYPNPFNPVTKIKFSVPQNQFIKIKVYDIQGKEIQQLVNEKVQAGNYETEFNGNNFSTGIYYYALESENFRVTKKMLLIK